MSVLEGNGDWSVYMRYQNNGSACTDIHCLHFNDSATVEIPGTVKILMDDKCKPQQNKQSANKKEEIKNTERSINSTNYLKSSQKMAVHDLL